MEGLDQVPRWELAVVLAKYKGSGIIEDIYSGHCTAVLFNGNVREPRIKTEPYAFWIEKIDVQQSGIKFNVLSILRPSKAQKKIFLKMSENLSWGGVSDDSWMLDFTSAPSTSTSPNLFSFSDQETQVVDNLINELEKAEAIYDIIDSIVEKVVN